VLNTKQVSFI